MKKKNLEYNDFNLINTVRVFFTNVYNYYATIVYYLFFFIIILMCSSSAYTIIGSGYAFSQRSEMICHSSACLFLITNGEVEQYGKKKNHCPDGFLVYFNRTRTIIIIRESDEVVYRSGFVIFNVWEQWGTGKKKRNETT